MADYPGMVFEFPDFDVVIPLICHKCGNCCRRYYVPVDFESLPEISQVLKQPIHHIQEMLNQNLERYIKGSPADCLFLSGCRCLIHDIRPEACRQFPSLTDSAPAMVDCPSHKEFKMIERLLHAQGGVKTSMPTSSRTPREIPQPELVVLLNVLKNAGGADSLVRECIILNRTKP